MCGSLSWAKQSSVADASCSISLYSLASRSMVPALSFTPSSAVFTGSVYAPGGIYIGDAQKWRLSVDGVTGDLVIQKYESGLSRYVNKLVVTETGV